MFIGSFESCNAVRQQERTRGRKLEWRSKAQRNSSTLEPVGSIRSTVKGQADRPERRLKFAKTFVGARSELRKRDRHSGRGGSLLLVVTSLLNFSVLRQLRAVREQVETASRMFDAAQQGPEIQLVQRRWMNA